MNGSYREYDAICRMTEVGRKAAIGSDIRKRVESATPIRACKTAGNVGFGLRFSAGSFSS